MEVSIIIVNYNTKTLTANCIESINSKILDIKYEIIIVDNSSADGSAEYLANFRNVKIIKAGSNLGFGKANNLGVKHAKYDYVWFLNSDTIILNNVLKHFIDFYKNFNFNIGVVGSLLLDTNDNVGPSFGYFVHPLKEIMNIFIEKFIDVNRFSNKHNNNISNSEYFKVDWISGASMFMRRELFKEIGEFDPKFFMYSEEVDLQKRINKFGYENFIIKGPSVIHLEGGSSKNKNEKTFNSKKYITITTSKIIYVKNNYSKFVYLIYYFLLATITTLKVIVNRNILIKDKVKIIKSFFYE